MKKKELKIEKLEGKIQNNTVLLLLFCLIILAGIYITYHYSPKKGASFIYEQF